MPLKAVSKDEMREILSEHLKRFRTWTYASLVERVDRGPLWKTHDCLELVEGVSGDGTEFQIQFDVDWRDKPGGDVGVNGSLSSVPQRPLFGFIPIYTADVTDGFFMAPDGQIRGAGD